MLVSASSCGFLIIGVTKLVEKSIHESWCDLECDAAALVVAEICQRVRSVGADLRRRW